VQRDFTAPAPNRLWVTDLTMIPTLEGPPVAVGDPRRLVYGIIKAGADSFTDTKVMLALFTGVVASVAFVLVERSSSSPMLDLTLFRSPSFTATALIAMISFLGLIGFFFALSLYFGMVQQPSTLESAWRLLMVCIVPMVLGVPMGRLVHRVSPRVLPAPWADPGCSAGWVS